MTGSASRFIQEFAILAPPFLLALTMHELAHGYVAYRYGDPTAQQAGRLTLNPLKHLDLLGTLLFFIIHVGWAKPVPVNQSYFKRPERDMLWVALAGPVMNILLAIVSALLLKLFALTTEVLPIFVLQPFMLMLAASVWINIMLAIFNLLPIPPLDGGRILTGLLPPQLAHHVRRIEPFGFILFILLFYSGVVPKFIMPLISFAHALLTD